MHQFFHSLRHSPNFVTFKPAEPEDQALFQHWAQLGITGWKNQPARIDSINQPFSFSEYAQRAVLGALAPLSGNLKPVSPVANQVRFVNGQCQIFTPEENFTSSCYSFTPNYSIAKADHVLVGSVSATANAPTHLASNLVSIDTELAHTNLWQAGLVGEQAEPLVSESAVSFLAQAREQACQARQALAQGRKHFVVSHHAPLVHLLHLEPFGIKLHYFQRYGSNRELADTLHCRYNSFVSLFRQLDELGLKQTQNPQLPKQLLAQALTYSRLVVELEAAYARGEDFLWPVSNLDPLVHAPAKGQKRSEDFSFLSQQVGKQAHWQAKAAVTGAKQTASLAKLAASGAASSHRAEVTQKQTAVDLSESSTSSTSSTLASAKVPYNSSLGTQPQPFSQACQVKELTKQQQLELLQRESQLYGSGQFAQPVLAEQRKPVSDQTAIANTLATKAVLEKYSNRSASLPTHLGHGLAQANQPLVSEQARTGRRIDAPNHPYVSAAEVVDAVIQAVDDVNATPLTKAKPNYHEHLEQVVQQLPRPNTGQWGNYATGAFFAQAYQDHLDQNLYQKLRALTPTAARNHWLQGITWSNLELLGQVAVSHYQDSDIDFLKLELANTFVRLIRLVDQMPESELFVPHQREYLDYFGTQVEPGRMYLVSLADFIYGLTGEVYMQLQKQMQSWLELNQVGG